MIKKIFIVSIFLAGFFFTGNFGMRSVFAISSSSDRISTSWPGVGANHTITFKIYETIPAGGSIEITPETSYFSIPIGFDYTDVDIATSALASGPFFDRAIGSSVSSTTDTINSFGATSTSGTIKFFLNTNFGISTGTYVQIELGTNAAYQAIGDKQIINASATGSFGMLIATYDGVDNLIERQKVMIAMVDPVTMSSNMVYARLYGSPIGYLAYNTTQTMLSMVTNYSAHCRFSTASGTPYDSMTQEFSYLDDYYTNYHTTMISGLTNSTEYNYYVRCEDRAGNKDVNTICFYASTTPYVDGLGDPVYQLNCLDYWIPFTVSGVPSSGDDVSGTPGPGGGGIGGGSGGGIGNDKGRGTGDYLPYPPLPGSPGIVFQGWGYPSRDVHILKDGVEQGLAASDINATFGAYLEEEVQGVYTFSLWSDDSSGRKSTTQSFTFFLESGTQTTISDIIIPPTIALNKKSIESGEQIEVFGQSTPLLTVEIWYYPKITGETKEEDMVKIKTVANDVGNWLASINTAGLGIGVYQIKAKTIRVDIGESNFSQVLDFGVAQEMEQDFCANADLNGDGKINLVDFSILLYHWKTDDRCADQNNDGTVDLIDFSIMMYYWTG